MRESDCLQLIVEPVVIGLYILENRRGNHKTPLWFTPAFSNPDGIEESLFLAIPERDRFMFITDTSLRLHNSKRILKEAESLFTDRM